MHLRSTLVAAMSVAALLVAPGCSVTRGQSSVGEYVDDTSITVAVKTKFIEDSQVDTGAIKVETLNGTVLLSGFAKNDSERMAAETIARGVKGVKSVQNSITVRS